MIKCASIYLWIIIDGQFLVNNLKVLRYSLEVGIELQLMKKLQLTFNKKYATSTRIGFGHISQVYLGFELSSQKQIAIKLDKVEDQDSTLQRQAKFYRLIKDGVGIPNLYWYGIQNNYRALVTDVLGPSLQQLLKYCKGTFTLKTVLLIADQILDRIEWIHSKGLVYNDLEPDNFLVGLGEKQDKIFIIDFGNCQKYLDADNRHFAFGIEKEQFKVNPRFRSILSHTKKKTGRRDDLQSLGYMLIYFLKGKLPWDDIPVDDQNRDLTIKQRKVSVPLSLLCEGLPVQFRKYFDYVKTLEYEQEPDYEWLRRLLKDLFESSGYVNNRVLDWAEKHKY